MQTASGSPAIAARGLGKNYGATQALSELNLDVTRGQICAVLGQNGAGKTTFINCALGLTTPSSGTVKVFGHSAGSIAARRRIGVMLQDTDLPDTLSGREHLALFSNYFAEPVDVDSLIDATGITAFADRRYKALSGGQKRRVQFALALVGRPDVLFLDEPTTGLDQDARRAVWDSARRLAGEGRTVILTTHYLEEADALADRIVVLSAGRIIAEGAAEAVRERVGGALISCSTHVDEDVAARLPAVRSIQRMGRLLTLLSENPARTLTDLLALDPDVNDLTVKKPSLEEAFSALTEHEKEKH